ncbi:MAG: YhgE/Pip family protein, partial [Lachnospiraceae bacterium]|nr:YhgE/Pip family protein [Lachnospiraceae bacterium]
MLKNEWKKLFQSKFMIAVMVAIILIPTIYTAIFVGAMWDPYGRLERLPVAVVNKDQPVMYNEKELNVGEDLIKNMKEDNSLGFHFVDEKTAESGLANGMYYMVITIPEDFSQNATTLMEDDTKKMELYYTTNPGENYIASKMSETAVSKIQQSIREKITTQYAETVFEQLETIGDGFVEAADGALQITDGTDQLLEGNQKMNDGLNALSEGTSSLQQGSATLEEGIGAYTEGVAALENGAALLNEKGSSLKTGVDSVSNGLISLKSGSGAILAGMNQMSDTLASSMTPEKEAQIQQLQTGLTGVNNAIVQANQLMQVINTKQGLGQ